MSVLVLRYSMRSSLPSGRLCASRHFRSGSVTSGSQLDAPWRQLTISTLCRHSPGNPDFTVKWRLCRRRIASAIFSAAERELDRVPVVDAAGRCSYRSLLQQAGLLASELSTTVSDQQHAPVCFLALNDRQYVVMLLSIWMCGHIAVPLSPVHPAAQWHYFIENSGASAVLVDIQLATRLTALSADCRVPLLVASAASNDDSAQTPLLSPQWRQTDQFYQRAPAMILYTSGTTGPPKGVLLSHRSLLQQSRSMVELWHWTRDDVLLHTLPLHHTHGIVNALLTPLTVAARCVMLPRFDAEVVWMHLLGDADVSAEDQINMFMAVPTIYSKLLETFATMEADDPGLSDRVLHACHQIRLMVSGSAALPVPVLERWRSVTGHTLLERYGMTEIGMALSNPLQGSRTPGAVGRPMPSVEVQIVQFHEDSTEFTVVAEADEKQCRVNPHFEGQSGELLVRGPSVATGYWRSRQHKSAAVNTTTTAGVDTVTPAATDAISTAATDTSAGTDAISTADNTDTTPLEMVGDGWFRTGDTAAVRAAADGTAVFHILGRTSVDIIKSAGYKISALDVERHLLQHPAVVDVAVVGLPDPIWGQKVTAVVVCRSAVDLSELRVWCRDRLPQYSAPSQLHVLDSMPRNAMGKVNKKQLINQLRATSE